MMSKSRFPAGRSFFSGAVLCAVIFASSSVRAEPESQPSTGTWKKLPGEIRQPKGNWQVPGEIQKPRDVWQTPGAFQKPNGEWLSPKEIPIPKEIAAVTIRDTAKCERKLSLGADALFDFDKSELSADGSRALAALGPIIVGHKPRAVLIEGHTDSKGSDEYNNALSLRRAETVGGWLKMRNFLPPSVNISGMGEKSPIAPNEKSDGADDPEGRQRNRRVEVVLLAACEAS